MTDLAVEQEFDLKAYLKDLSTIPLIDNTYRPATLTLVPGSINKKEAIETAKSIGTDAILFERQADKAPYEFYPMLVDQPYEWRFSRFGRTAATLSNRTFVYDELVDPKEACISSRLQAGLIMHTFQPGVKFPVRLRSPEVVYQTMTGEELAATAAVVGRFHASYVANFLVIGMKAFFTLGMVDPGSDNIDPLGKLSPSASAAVTVAHSRTWATKCHLWTAYYDFMSVLFGMKRSTMNQRRMLYDQFTTTESFEDLKITIGGSIVSGYLAGTGRYTPAVKRTNFHSFVAELLVIGGACLDTDLQEIRLTDFGNKVAETFAALDDQDMMLKWYDPSVCMPPNIPADRATYVDEWLLEYFTTMKAIADKL